MLRDDGRGRAALRERPDMAAGGADGRCVEYIVHGDDAERGGGRAAHGADERSEGGRSVDDQGPVDVVERTLREPEPVVDWMTVRVGEDGGDDCDVRRRRQPGARTIGRELGQTESLDGTR